jgi:hypothetical protein
MKLIAIGGAIIAASASLASAAVYNDATGENFDGNGHMDISSVEVTNTATDITFKISTTGALTSPNDWGKYCVGISKGNGLGDTGAPVGNPWGRNISMASGMNAWIGSWADSGGGAQAFTYSGSWTQNSQVVPTLAANSTTYTFTLASLGLALGDTIHFDAYTTGGGGGDSANDVSSLASQSISNWPGPYVTPAGGGSVYVLAVPEPATLGTIAGAALVALRRRK